METRQRKQIVLAQKFLRSPKLVHRLVRMSNGFSIKCHIHGIESNSGWVCMKGSNKSLDTMRHALA